MPSINQHENKPVFNNYLMSTFNILSPLGTEQNVRPSVQVEIAATSNKEEIKVLHNNTLKKQLVEKYLSRSNNNDPIVWNEPLNCYDISESPFDKIFYSEESKRNIFIKSINNLRFHYAEKLQRRIEILNEVSKEEYPNEKLISINSLEGLLKFFNQNESFKYTETTITSDGNIRIQWQKDIKNHFALEFISNNEVKFVLFVPDIKNPVKIARIAGKISIESILPVIEPYNVLSWLTE